MYSTPMYENIPGRPLEYASTILACLAFCVTIPIYVFYWKGPQIREHSKFAQSVNETWLKSKEKRGSLTAGATEGGEGFKAGIGEEKKESV